MRFSVIFIVLLSLVAFPAFAADVVEFDFPEEYQGLWFCSDFHGDRALMEITSEDLYMNGQSFISELKNMNMISFSTRESPVTYSISTAYTEDDSANIVETYLVFALDRNDGLFLCVTFKETPPEGIPFQGTEFYDFARF